ncbi:MAG: polysaccharide deacetylase family protein [Gemmatimonadales bacterium]
MPGARIAGFAYHDVTDEPGDSGLQRPAAHAYKLSRAAFGRHLDAIASASLHPELVTAIDPAMEGPHLLLTFDDGGKSALYASDELCRRGWLGHFFIITARIGERTFLDATEIRYLRQCGHVIGSHSHTHPSFFREQTPHQMMAEWATSCDRLANLLGEPCTVGSVPGGDISPVVLASAGAAGLRYLFTSDPTLVPQSVGRCWVLGRFCPKVTTRPSRVGELASFRGWERALFIRRLKVFVRVMLPGPYRRYVRRQTRETRASGRARQPVAGER